MILQLIPLIALCCVLQRNRKPSHPSQHVVRAVVKKDFFFERQPRDPGEKEPKLQISLRTNAGKKVFFWVLGAR